MAAAKIKKGDSVVVLSGKDKGLTGTVSKVLPAEGKVVVAGVNVATRHRKPSQANPQGGIVRFEAPMHISKVAVADPKRSEEPTSELQSLMRISYAVFCLKKNKKKQIRTQHQNTRTNTKK